MTITVEVIKWVRKDGEFKNKPPFSSHDDSTWIAHKGYWLEIVIHAGDDTGETVSRHS